MKHRNMAWLYFLVAALWTIVVLRDLFAPGFLAMNNRVMGRWDIIVEIFTAAIFLTLGVLKSKRHRLAGIGSDNVQ